MAMSNSGGKLSTWLNSQNIFALILDSSLVLPLALSTKGWLQYLLQIRPWRCSTWWTKTCSIWWNWVFSHMHVSSSNWESSGRIISWYPIPTLEAYQSSTKALKIRIKLSKYWTSTRPRLDTWSFARSTNWWFLSTKQEELKYGTQQLTISQRIQSSNTRVSLTQTFMH